MSGLNTDQSINQQINQSENQSGLEIKKAAQLSLTEIGLGSVGHGFKIPLTGHILSLNQLAFLLNATNRDLLPKSAVFEISGISAVLKSFSPAGKRIGPMLSIAMQGFLFWLSMTVVGTNVIGQCIGAVLLAVWAFIQPALTLLLIYGFDIVKIAEFYIQKVTEDYAFLAMALVYALLTVFILKIFLAVGMVIISLKFKKEIQVLKPSDKVLGMASPIKTGGSPLKSALQDMLKPLFLLSFALMLIFLTQINGNLTDKIWMGMRPLAAAFCIFYFLRSPWVATKLLQLSAKNKSFASIYDKAQAAYKIMNKNNDKPN